jgi:2'-5' RNA ligase
MEHRHHANKQMFVFSSVFKSRISASVSSMAETNQADQWRLFLAISIPEAVKTRIERTQSALRSELAAGRIRWTPREQLHLTLHFLGNVSPQKVEALAETVRSACLGFAPLHLSAERIGFFPNPRRPRVVWVGVGDHGAHLPRLQRALVAAVAPFTTETAKEDFIGHVTLGRVKSLSRTEAERLADAAGGAADQFFGEWDAGQVELFRSQLSAQGAVHTLAGVAAFGAGR